MRRKKWPSADVTGIRVRDFRDYHRLMGFESLLRRHGLELAD